MRGWLGVTAVFCLRCGRVAPDRHAEAFLTWGAADSAGNGLLCTGCLAAQRALMRVPRRPNEGFIRSDC